MTALSACIGLFPAAISTGIGSQVQRPLATVIVGGMLVGPLMLLVAVPALRMIFLSRGDRTLHANVESAPPPHPESEDEGNFSHIADDGPRGVVQTAGLRGAEFAASARDVRGCIEASEQPERRRQKRLAGRCSSERRDSAPRREGQSLPAIIFRAAELAVTKQIHQQAVGNSQAGLPLAQKREAFARMVPPSPPLP